MSVFRHRQRIRDSHSGWCSLARGDGEETSLGGVREKQQKKKNQAPVMVTVLLTG